MTLYEWTERWMEKDVRAKVRPSTYAAKRYVLQNHIYPKLGDVSLDKLTEARIGAFLDERKRSGGSRPECPDYPGLSDVTMRHIHRLLKECLDRAVEAGLIENNSARAFRYDTQRKAKVTALSENEIDAYLDAAEELGHLHADADRGTATAGAAHTEMERLR